MESGVYVLSLSPLQALKNDAVEKDAVAMETDSNPAPPTNQ